MRKKPIYEAQRKCLEIFLPVSGVFKKKSYETTNVIFWNVKHLKNNTLNRTIR